MVGHTESAINKELDLMYKIPYSCPISSRNLWNIDELKEQMWQALDLGMHFEGTQCGYALNS